MGAERTPFHGSLATDGADEKINAGEREDQVTPRWLGVGNRC
jgi:hypothetical protein